jgi:Rhs element Vgr protein
MPVIPGNDIGVGSIRTTIKINGSTMSDSYGVSEITVHHSINQISYAEITLSGEDPSASSIPSQDGSTFNPGNTITISIAYDSNAEVKIFDGLIVQQGIDVAKKTNLKINLLCKHKLVTSTYNRQEEEYHDKTDSKIIQTILSDYGVSATVGSTNITYEVLVQKLATDWDFVCSRAQFNGFIITMDGTSVEVKKPVFSSSPVLTVGYGISIISFKGEVSAERQPPTLDASAWDIKTMALIKSSATEPSVNSQGNLTPKTLSSKLSQKALSLLSNTLMTTADLKAWADGILLKLRLAAIKGEVTYIGNSVVKTGDIITLEGVGGKFNGSAFVSTVIHRIKPRASWETTVKFGLDDEFVHEKINLNYPAATGQLPAISGLQIGKVKQLSKDPQSLNRILVILQTNATTKTGVWARYANFYATSSAGAAFLPEVNDEVVVGFLENDPRNPVILGSLYGKNAPANVPADDKNFIKEIQTKAKLKINFDDENKIITITTPGKNLITFDDKEKQISIKDQNKNTIVMSSTGIAFTSDKDIKLTAKGSIVLSATSKLTLSAKQDATIEGLNVSLKAKAGLTAKGTSKAEFSSGGQTILKGALVNIN